MRQAFLSLLFLLNGEAGADEAQKLLSPAEMGELFKVLAVGKGIPGPLMGFRSGDRSATL